MKVSKIDTLDDYSDWLEKAKYELLRFKTTFNVYDMAKCFLTLNAIPEWIVKSDKAPAKLRGVACLKIRIMGGKDFKLDEKKLTELDHQLRLVRMLCNHSKHGGPKEEEPLENLSMSAQFPLEFPVKFEFLSVGSKSVNALEILQSVINFWEEELRNA